VNPDRLDRRLGLMKDLEAPLGRTGAAPLVREHQALYDQTARMALSPRVKAFDLAREPEKVRESYGRSAFGQGCLMAPRLVDAGGEEVVERPVTVPDLFCTFCQALNIDPRFENQSNVGRPLKIVETGRAVQEVF